MKLTDNRWLTGRGFGVHSPWAYDLIENVINERHPYYAYEDLYPFWEKAPQYLPQYPQSRDELLFRLVNRFNPKFILEVGTGAGVSTGYLASVSKESRVVTVDFPHPAEKEVRRNLKKIPNIVVYAQMTRGKMERNVAYALASVAATISRLAFDACMYNSQNFGFIKLPDDCTTGSSIMPHKKNPDVFELTRAKCNRLQAIPQEITLMTNNLPSGYFRDMQLVKEVFLPAFQELEEIITMTAYMLDHIKVSEDILSDPKYDAIFSVEEVNRLAREGMPFREAYRKVGAEIENGTFKADRNIHHTHEGSIGNLCNDRIAARMESLVSGFPFSEIDKAVNKLTSK